jgi:hypothetical protein
MSKTLLPKVVSTRVVNKARFLSLCELVKRIKMFAQVNRPPRIHILHNTKIWIECYYTFQCLCQFTHIYQIHTKFRNM